MDRDLSRYARQTMLPQLGEEGQRRLRAASVLVVGLGGLGAPVSIYLTGAGVGRIGLCDADTVSLTNLQRQVLYTEGQIGQPKTACARERLAAMSGATAFDVYPEGLTAENADSIIAGYDLVVDCCDNFATRYLIDDACARLGKPWVYGSIGEFNGQLALMGGRRGLRYTALYPDRDALCARPRTVAGVLGPVPGIVGAMQAAEALKWLAGIECALDGTLFAIDTLTFETYKLQY